MVKDTASTKRVSTAWWLSLFTSHFAFCPFFVSASAAEPPNIVIIYADDVGGRVAGFEGNTEIRTPNLDALAATSARFTRCYVPTPQDIPSRASLLTGQYPHTHGVTTEDGELSRLSTTFGSYLRKAGYACGFVGKWSLGGDDDGSVAAGFDDYTAVSQSPVTSEQWGETRIRMQGREGTADKYLTDWETDRGIEFIESVKGKSFLLMLAYHAPSEPLAWPAGMEKAYEASGFELPATSKSAPLGVPPTLGRSAPAERFQKTPNREQALREMTAKYYAMITRLDENVGRLLRRLKELELDDSTAVIFTSNGGFALGSHQLIGQGPFFYDELTRVPLLFRVPGMAGAAEIPRIVSAIDVAPSVLELAGLPAPMVMQGRSLLRIIAEPEAPHADEAFFEFHKQPGYAPPRPAPPPPVAAAHAQPAGGSAVSPKPPATQPWSPRLGLTATQPARVGEAPPQSQPEPPRFPPPATQAFGPRSGGSATRPWLNAVQPPDHAPLPPRQPMTRPRYAATPHTRPLNPVHPGTQSAPSELEEMSQEVPAMPEIPSAPPAPPVADVVTPARGIVTTQFKFIDYLQDADVLFDLKRDPEEMHNLASDGSYALVVKILRERLERWKKDTRDQPPTN